MKKVVIWYNPNKDIYYYRVVRGIHYETYDYEVGSINSFGHIIVLVISYEDILLSLKPQVMYSYSLHDLRTKTIKRLISFLKKFL